MQLTESDTGAVAAKSNSALVPSGLSCGWCAPALGGSPSLPPKHLTGASQGSLLHCTRADGLASSLTAADHAGLMSAHATAEAVRQGLSAGEVDWAMRMLVQGRDHLRLMLAEPDESLVGSWETSPASIGSKEFDTLLAAVAGREFERVNRAEPAWTRIDPLPGPWVREHPFLSRDRVLAKTPEWLARLNIFIPGRDLVTA